MSRTASILLAATVAAGLGLWWLASTQKESAPAPLARESASSNAPEPAPELGLAAPEPRASAAVPEVPPAPPQPADAAPRATLLVRVVSASERTPLARARLTITSEDPALDRPSVDVNGTHGSLAESPLTDAEGRAEFELPPGAAFTLWTLWIQGGEIAAEAGPRPIPALRPDERREMLVELATGNDLRFCGRVVRRTDRTPVSGARVRGTDAEITTDSDGRFGLQVASWRPPSLRVEATGFGLSVVTPTKGHETPELAFEIALSAGATLEARVLDAVGNPLPGASVRLTARSFELRRASEDALSDFAWVLDEVREAATEPDGRCVLADLAAGVRWSVEVLRDAAVVLREGDPIFLAPGQVLAREWRIGRAGRSPASRWTSTRSRYLSSRSGSRRPARDRCGSSSRTRPRTRSRRRRRTAQDASSSATSRPARGRSDREPGRSPSPRRATPLPRRPRSR
jgi:hypothetical protein